MQTTLTRALLQTPDGREADEILRNCVHCGFCNATCPTYRLTGDELDGPRGRIYLIKQVLEGHTPTHRTQLHLDRCLTCRACETTCPSGVDYHRLLDTGRELVERQVPRKTGQRLLRLALRTVLPYPGRFRPLLRAAQLLRPLLPAALKQRLPVRRKMAPVEPARQFARTMLLPDGCVQPALAPQINHAARRVLAAFGIGAITPGRGGCCGALSHHLGAAGEAGRFMRANIDAWWPAIEAGVEAIVITASGCAPMVKDYGRLLAADPAYAGKAARVSELARDVSEVLAAQQQEGVVRRREEYRKIAFHSPCTLQHAQQLDGTVEKLLTRLGYELLPVTDAHLCCGSAGTYSILQPELATRLREAKLANLLADCPELIATANIGCLQHMAGHAGVPVMHWLELLEPRTMETNT